MHTTYASVPTTSLRAWYTGSVDPKDLSALQAAILNRLQAQDATIVSATVEIVADGKAIKVGVTAPQPVDANNIKAWL